MSMFPSRPDLGQPNPGQYGPPAPGSQNNPLRPPGFDLGQPNPGQYGPPAPGSQNNPQQADLWSRLMNAVGNPTAGQFRMPGTTIGAPAGQTPPALPTPPPLPQGQMPAPGGANFQPPPIMPLGNYFRNQQFPQGGGNTNQLMAQYMALQQLMQR